MAKKKKNTYEVAELGLVRGLLSTDLDEEWGEGDWARYVVSGQELSHQDIATIFQVSQTEVRRIEKSALSKLRADHSAVGILTQYLLSKKENQ